VTEGFLQFLLVPLLRYPESMNSKSFPNIIFLFAQLVFVTVSLTVKPCAQATDPKTVPVVDGGAGPCSAEFTVTDSAGAPIYDAKIRVHIAYRFMSAHKLDLEVGTNAEGKAHFEGLPNKLKRGLTFYATHDSQEGPAFDDPTTTCKAQLTITLHPKNGTP
jgi:hypothetical protein